MIPSRPLSVSEIIRETFSIYIHIFPRYVLLFLLLCIPGILLVTYGSTSLTHDVVSAAHHDIDFSDNDLTAVRNQMRNWLTVHNPMLLQEEQILEQLDTTAKSTSRDTTQQYIHGDSKQIFYYFSSNLARFETPIGILLFGGLLLFLGTIGLTGTVTDLACQVFEERDWDIPGALKANYARHVWKMLLLYVLYMALSSGVDQTFSAIETYSPQIADSLGAIRTVAQIYIFLRLAFTIPALVSEEIGPFAALARSWRLTVRSGWRIMGAMVVFGLILSAAGMFLFILSGLIVSGTFFPWIEEFLQQPHLSVSWFLTTIPDFIHSIVIYAGIPFFILFALVPIFATVFYYDLRTRRDGPLVYLDEPDAIGMTRDLSSH